MKLLLGVLIVTCLTGCVLTPNNNLVIIPTTDSPSSVDFGHNCFIYNRVNTNNTSDMNQVLKDDDSSGMDSLRVAASITGRTNTLKTPTVCEPKSNIYIRVP